tara:strand:+ start:322 stop:540 length:219 start_codon:yes stop_codon:yes gene_type:complete
MILRNGTLSPTLGVNSRKSNRQTKLILRNGILSSSLVIRRSNIKTIMSTTFTVIKKIFSIPRIATSKITGVE